MASHVDYSVFEHFHVPVTFMNVRKDREEVTAIKTAALINSGASTTFISQALVDKLNLRMYCLDREVSLLNIDGTPNTAGTITHYTYQTLCIPNKYGHKSNIVMAITDIDDQDLILGIDWLQQHNPTIDWAKGTFTLTCCGLRRYPLTVKRTFPPDEIRICTEYKDIHQMYQRDPLYRILTGFSKSQQLAEQARDKTIKTFYEMVPQEYHKYKKVFSKEESNRLPEHKEWDLEITLKEGKELPKPQKAFQMSPPELKAIKEFIKQEQRLGRIRPSKSETSAPVFFIKKNDRGLRLVQDYQALNEVTVKNQYPIPLSSNFIDYLREAKYFTHLDLRNGYNNIRIKKGHKYKLVFQTLLGLFEPLVMYFGMTNAPGAFQALMNNIFRDLIINTQVAVYLDDILIYSKTLEEHRETVKQVLQRLAKNDLYLKLEKCEFDKTKTEFLGSIISQGNIEMDPIKIKGVSDWPTPKKLKDVQSLHGIFQLLSKVYQRLLRNSTTPE